MADRTVTYRLRAEIGQLRAQMAQASAATRKVADDMTALTKEGAKSRRGLESVGSAAGKMGLVAAAGLGAAVVKAADFESSMSKVQAATHETAANMEALREAALEAGAQTAFSATEAAAGIENLAKAGVSTQEILSGGLMGALDLAAAGEMEVADAAEAAAGAMAQFKLEGEDVPHIADLLAAGAGKAQGEVSDMVMALKQAGTVSSQTGLTLEETTGALAALAEQSLLGSDAGTSFKTMLASLTPNSQKAASAMEQYGISAFDAAGNFVGLTELAGQLREGLGDLTQEQRAATLETIFGSDAVRAASIIYDNGAEGIQNWIDKTNDQGYAAETAAIKLDNLKGDLEAFMGSLETALIGTGEGAQGPLRSLVQGATDLLNAFNALPGPVKNATAAMLGITAVLGGGLWFTSKVVGGIANTRSALDDLGISASRSGRLMKGVGAGFAVAGAVASIAAVDAALDSMFDKKSSGSDLPRHIEALALTGRLEGSLKNVGQHLSLIANQDFSSAERWFGMIPGVDSSIEEAADEIERIDQALASLVEGGSADHARTAFEEIEAQLRAAGASSSEVDKMIAAFDSYALAVENAGSATEGAAAEAEGLATAASGAAGAVGELSTMTAEQAKALEESRKAARETATEFFGLGENVDKAKVSLGEWIRDLERQAKALRDFQSNAEEAGRKGLSEGLIAALQEAGPAGALRMEQLANATQKEIDRANRAWRAGERAIDDYTDAVGGVPPATLRVNNGPALEGIDEAIDRLKDFKDKTITIRVTASGTAAISPGFGPQGSGFASGGWTGPGGKYEPKGVVHGDEFVFSKEATHGNVAMLERLHRHLRGYANGGLVQRHVTSTPVMAMGGGGVSIDYQRLASAMALVRPLYGDVHVSGDGSFRREMIADSQRRNAGGF